MGLKASMDESIPDLLLCVIPIRGALKSIPGVQLGRVVNSSKLV